MCSKIGRPRAGTMDSSPSAPRSWALSAPAPQTASSQLSTWYFCPLSCSTDYFLSFLFFFFFKSPFTSCLPSCPAHSGFPGGSDGEESACNMGDLGSIPALGRSSGGGHSNPLQYSCLEKPHGQKSLAGYSPWGLKESPWGT